MVARPSVNRATGDAIQARVWRPASNSKKRVQNSDTAPRLGMRLCAIEGRHSCRCGRAKRNRARNTADLGLELEDLSVDGCIVNAPCGGEAAGRSSVDRGKQDTKWSLLVDGRGDPAELCEGRAELHDSPLLATAETVPVRFRPARTDHRAPGRWLRLWQDPRSARYAHSDVGKDCLCNRQACDSCECGCWTNLGAKAVTISAVPVKKLVITSLWSSGSCSTTPASSSLTRAYMSVSWLTPVA